MLVTTIDPTLLVSSAHNTGRGLGMLHSILNEMAEGAAHLLSHGAAAKDIRTR
jgi:hypothetical protein